MPDTLAWWTVQAACPECFSGHTLPTPSQLSDTAIRPQKLTPVSASTRGPLTGLLPDTVGSQTLSNPQYSKGIGIWHEWSFLVGDAWVTFGHPGTLAGFVLNTALEVKDSSPECNTQDLWCSSYQQASLASQRSHMLSPFNIHYTMFHYPHTFSYFLILIKIISWIGS